MDEIRQISHCQNCSKTSDTFAVFVKERHTLTSALRGILFHLLFHLFQLALLAGMVWDSSLCTDVTDLWK